MKRIQLVHWKPEEAGPRVAWLRKAGYRVLLRSPGPEFLKDLRSRPPDAVVIDLERLPSQGRDVGVALRHRKATRGIPLVLAGGEGGKVERIRKVLPDAVFTPWSRVRAALRRAMAHPPAEPAAPPSTLAAYSGTPLPRKLGIREDIVVAVIGAPPGFRRTLGRLPRGARLRDTARGRADLTVWFARSRRVLDRRIGQMAARADHGPLWIAWPKKAAETGSDLTQKAVRAAGLAAGLVDYKICAIDPTWSGLLFTRG